MTAELEQYLAFFEDYWTQARKLLADLPPAALNWRPLEGGDEHATNSLAATLTHIAGAQQYWVGEVAGGRRGQRDRAAEFKVQAADAAELLRRLQAAGKVARQVLRVLTAEQLDQTVEIRGRAVTRRWAVLHALEHLALHVGHMQLTRLRACPELNVDAHAGPQPGREFEQLDSGLVDDVAAQGFGQRRDSGQVTRNALVEGFDQNGDLLANGDPGHIALAEVGGLHLQMRQVANRDYWLARRDPLAGVNAQIGDGAADGGLQIEIAQRRLAAYSSSLMVLAIMVLC